MKNSFLIDRIISQVNSSIEKIDFGQDLDKLNKNLFPIFIIGAPRSGTTLLYQAIVSKFYVEYPSNFIAKFWDNPIVGYAIQKALLSENSYISSFKSQYGYTKNEFLEPHEFGYFWLKWFKNDFSHYTSIDTNVDGKLKSVINNLMQLSGKNWVFKNLTLGLKIPVIKRIFPKAKFIIVKRNPLMIGLSLLKTRKEINNNNQQWWSLIPKEIDEIIKLIPEEQVIAQVFYIYKQIYNDLKTLESNDIFEISYEVFCENADYELGKIGKQFNLINKSNIPDKFPVKIEINNHSETVKLLNKYCNKYSKQITGVLDEYL